MDYTHFTLMSVGALLLLIDWILGRQNQRLLRKRCRWWFYHVRKSSFRGLLNEDAALLRGIAERWLGGKWYSLRVPLFVFVLSTLSVVAFLEWYFAGPFWKVTHLIAAHALVIVPINVFFAWVSYLVTLRLLRLMETSATLPRVAAVMLLDAILALGIVFLTVDSFIFWSNVEYTLLFDQRYDEWDSAVWAQLHLWIYVQGLLMSPLSPFFDATTLYWGENAARIITSAPRGVVAIPLLMVLVSVIPTVAHIIIGLAFIISKAFRPMLRPLLSLVLLRLSQSRVGVLTVIGSGLLLLAAVFAAWPQATPQLPA